MIRKKKQFEFKKMHIIRWSDPIEFPNGKTNLACVSGTQQQAEEYAGRIAEENGVKVEAII